MEASHRSRVPVCYIAAGEEAGQLGPTGKLYLAGA